MISKEGNNILFLASVPFYKSSGSPRAIFFKVKALSDLGYKVDIICYPHGEDIYLGGLKIFRSPQRKIFRNYIPGQYLKKLIYDFFIFISAIKHLIKSDYQFVIASGSMIYYGSLLSLFSNKCFVALQHGNIKMELYKWNITKNNFIGDAARKLEVSTLNTFDLIISEAKKSIEPLFYHGLKKNKTYIILGSAFSSPILKKKAITKVFIVLYTGTFVKVQNLELIYQTAKILINEKIEFRLIGGEPSELLEEKTKTSGLSNINFHERLPQKEFEEFLCDADIVISPRVIGDDTPMKIIDYLNFGKCILATNSNIHLELLNSEIAYLVNPTAMDFAEAILYLRDNETRRNIYAQKGKEFFEKELSFEVMKKNLSDVLKANNL